MSTSTPTTLLGVHVQRENGDDQAASSTATPVSNEAADALQKGPGKKISSRKVKAVTNVTAVRKRKRRNMDDKPSQSGPPASGLDAPGQPSNGHADNACHKPQLGDDDVAIGELVARGTQPRQYIQTATRHSIQNRLWTGTSAAMSWMTSSLFVVGLHRASRFGRYFETFVNSKAMAALVYVLSASLTGVGIVLFMVLTMTLGIAAAVVIGIIILAEDVYQISVVTKRRTAHWFQRRLPVTGEPAETE